MNERTKKNGFNENKRKCIGTGHHNVDTMFMPHFLELTKTLRQFILKPQCAQHWDLARNTNTERKNGYICLKAAYKFVKMKLAP